MSEMIERVANVFSDALERLQDEGHIEIRATADFSSKEIARAAIEAMREPTDAMAAAATFAVQSHSSAREADKAIYRAMIGEALK